VDHTNGVAALSQDKLNFIREIVHRERGGRSAASSGLLTISALVPSTWAVVRVLKSCSMSLTWALEVDSSKIHLDVSGGTLLA
jgi:hypothetical protein